MLEEFIFDLFYIKYLFASSRPRVLALKDAGDEKLITSHNYSLLSHVTEIIVSE